MLNGTTPPPKKRIVVLVSGGGSNLVALISAANRGDFPNGEIVSVIASNPTAGALQRATNVAIPTEVVCPRDFPDRAAYGDALYDTLQALRPDLIVLAGFLQILDRRITDAYQNQIINVHPSLIPSFCGAGYYGLRVHQAVLAAGVKLTGATVHFVNEIPDGGAIILQKAVEVLPHDNPETLQRRVMEQAEWILLPQAVGLFCADRLHP